MITKIEIYNFRSIKQLELEIKPLTVIYGRNATGKSSVIYPSFLLKKIVFNPNQNLTAFFNFGFVNLGNFTQIVYNHEPTRAVKILIHFKKELGEIIYGITLGQERSCFHLQFLNISETLPVSFPYALNDSKQLIISDNINLIWNGINVHTSGQIDEKTQTVVKEINSIIAEIKSIDLIPLNRGFTKPIFPFVSISPFAINQDEVASLLIANGGYLEGKVHVYCQKIFNKDFRTFSPPGAPNFYLRTIDENGFVSELINDGFGINQTIYMLTKILRPETKLVFIEEPEIHLHPTAQSKLIDAFINIIETEEKHIVISTHSETLVSSILANIEKRNFSPENVAFYLCEKKEGQTVLQEQKVNEYGQVEGGLISFMETELEELTSVLGAKNGEKGNNH